MASIQVEQAESITSFDLSEWACVAGDDTLWSHAWLRTIEENSRTSTYFRYFLAREDGRPVAITTASLDDGGDPVGGLDHVVFGGGVGIAHRIGFGIEPALVFGPRLSVTKPVKLRDGLSHETRQRARAAILDAAECIAGERGCSLCFRNIERTDHELRPILEQRGYLHSREMPTALLDIVWPDFRSYRQDLNRTHHATAKNISRDQNLGRRQGISIHTVDHPEQYGGHLHKILDDHYLRLNAHPFPLGPRFIEQVKTRLGDRARIYVAEAEGRPVGVCIGFLDGDAFRLPFVGVDRETLPKGRVYYNLCYNRPLADSIAEGFERVHLGRLQYRIKAGYGCFALEHNFYLRVPNAVHAFLLRALFACRSRRIDATTAVLPRQTLHPAGHAANPDAPCPVNEL